MIVGLEIEVGVMFRLMRELSGIYYLFKVWEGIGLGYGYMSGIREGIISSKKGVKGFNYEEWGLINFEVKWRRSECG